MKRSFRLGSYVVLTLALFAGVWLCATPEVHAQVAEGLTQIDPTIRLTATDPRILAARLINVFLGLLGIIFLGLTVYAGFLWMTSGGNPEGAERARTILRNAVIGLIIILTSWAITRYVITRLLEATNGGGGGSAQTDGGGGGGGFGAGGGASDFQLRSITPVGFVPIRNIRVRFVFNREVDEAAASSSIQVYRREGRVPVDGTLSVNGAVVEFVPSTTCPTAPTQYCFDGDTEFIAAVDRATMRSRALPGESSRRIICGGFALPCEAIFRTGNLVDTTPPSASIQAPYDGQSIPENDRVMIVTRATDDVGISYVTSSVNGRDVGVDAPTSTASVFTSSIEWSTVGAATGTYTLRSQANDLDSHSSMSSEVRVAIRSAHCFNGVQDGDETGIDCGSLTCGWCSAPGGAGGAGGAGGGAGAGGTGSGGAGGSGGTGSGGAGGSGGSSGSGGGASTSTAPTSCRVGTECRSGICRDGVCVEQPVILDVTPRDGRPGTLVTITGANFGRTIGQVHFWDGSAFTVAASAPVVCTSSTWASGQVIVQVPTGARTGAIRITNASSTLADATNDRNGPVLDDFTVNTVARPGLCMVAPGTGERGDVITLTGVDLGATPGRLWFGERDVTPPSFLAWGTTAVRFNVPVIAAASYPIRVRVGTQDSNSVAFGVTERIRTAPVITSVNPVSGPIGEYITILGRDFGSAVGTVFFRNTVTSEIGRADTTFPDACGLDFWRDTSVTVKVPPTIALRSTVTPGAYQIYLTRSGDASTSNRVNFAVNTNPARPGICAIAPVAGPVGTTVSVVGERLGGRTDSLTFQGPTSDARVPAVAIASWTPAAISADVPTGSRTGGVRVAVGTELSNAVPFTVRNCNEDASICGTETCCRDSGQCSVRGVCAAVAPSSMFGWEMSTGRLPLYPEVVEECPGPSGLPPSPSPWDGRPGGNAACVNAEMVLRFNTAIDPATINTRNVIISRCTATGDNPCATKVVVTGGPFFIGDSDARRGDRRTLVAFSPTGDAWQADSTYEVVLTTGITSASRIAMRPLERCGAGNGYCFRFRTRPSTDPCRLGSVSVTPNPFTAEDIAQIVSPYRGNALSLEDQCVQINPASLSWRWYTGRSLSLSDARATLLPFPPTDPLCGRVGGCSWLQQARAENETGPADPVLVNTQATNRGEAPVVGTGNLFIQFIPPRVISYGPNCDEACTEAKIWAEFNVPMDPAYATDRQILIYQCENENCRSFRPTTPLVLAPGSVRLIPARGDVPSPANRRIEIEPLDRTGRSLLTPGSFYKVILRGDLDPTRREGFRSRTGLALTELNDRQGFSWRFRVKSENAGLCDVTRVEVVPIEKIETVVGARELFTADPVHESQACGVQYLMSRGTYAWTSSATNVSKFVNSRGDGLVSASSILGPNCSGRCTNLGSQGVAGRVASCGNSRVETTDAAACRRASGAACTSTDTDCVVRTDPSQPCTVLLPGSRGGEECDLGDATTGGLNGVSGSLCGANCLWAGVDGGTCGNARIEPGEQCDPGRICLAGPTPGIACVRDDNCGTGGTCVFNARGTGCSERCLALGSASVTVPGEDSRCGNRSVGAGETCDDGNITDGDGCSSNCLHEGSYPIVAICGNGGPLEPGESCERVGTVWPARCNRTTCLNEGTDACRVGGDPTSRINCCGNGRREEGEDCDDNNASGGDGCSARCLAEGSSIGYLPTASICGDSLITVGEQCEADPRDIGIGNRQVSEIVGEAEPDTAGRMMSRLDATYRAKTGQADHGLQCGFRQEAECIGDPSLGRTLTSHGLTSNGCCMARPTVTTVRFPLPDSTNVCRNTEISFNFSQVMDEGSIQDNLVIGEEVTGDCPAGTTPLGSAYPRLCVGGVSGTLRYERSGPGTRAVFSLQRALKARTQYRILVRGDLDLTDTTSTGVRSARGVRMAGDTSWVFTTGERICAANNITIRDTDPVRPFLFQTPREAHPFSASIMSLQGGVLVPISSVAEYSWSWQPWLSSDGRILTTGADISDTIARRASTSTVTAQNRNGSSLIFAGIRIDADTVNIPSTIGQTIENSHIATVSLCERPWPSADPRYTGATLFSDSAPRISEPSVLRGGIFESGPYYNFATMYCMDAGQGAVATDDLPALTIRPSPPGASDISRGLLRQYLFTMEGTEISDSLRKDAIGIRVFQNPLHLSPQAWYRAQGFTGSPSTFSVDGYEAIRDGATIYVAAPNVESASGPATSTIYLISHNPDAEEQTEEIFNQLVANWFFNVNIQQDSSNVCKNGREVFVDSGRIVPCTSDWECAARGDALTCASFKAKIQRDGQRLADFQEFMTKLDQAYERDGKFPTIQNGSYIQGITNSRWGSWQSVLGTSIGMSLPIDPVNRFLTCGRCQYPGATAPGEPCIDAADCRTGGTCNGTPRATGSTALYDPSTCWEVANRRFLCPRLPSGPSRFYQYRSLGGGTGYELGTELEAVSYDRYRPALITGINRCSNTNQLCTSNDQCVVYYPGTTREQSRGTCQASGGQWRYTNVCTGREFGIDSVCGNGIRSSSEACEVGDTATASCVAESGRPGMKQQTCAPDCQGFIDGPTTRCIPLALCGNGRVDRYLCQGAGVRYGQSCTTPTSGMSSECSDPRDRDPVDPTREVMMRCVAISAIPSAGSEEICDDGALNGTYGHCNRTCTGYDALCGDGELSSGELCDNGSSGSNANGQYCDTRSLMSGGAGCVVENSCGFDCRTRAPFCGDGLLQRGDGEQCEIGQVETSTEKICSTGQFAGIKTCTVDADCNDSFGRGGFTCGNRSDAVDPIADLRIYGSCVGQTASRCIGYGMICEGGDRRRCSNDGDCAAGGAGRCVPRSRVDCSTNPQCGIGGRCNTYPTRRSRPCGPIDADQPADRVQQCTWGHWSACEPGSTCGDGVVDAGELCDDGNDSDNDACTTQCLPNVCGDGVLNPGVEQCDYGSQLIGGRNGLGCVSEYGATCATCTNFCRVEAQSGGFCGNARRDGREQCDFVKTCVGGTREGGTCNTDGECGSGGVCQYPGVTADLTCRGIGFDYANDSICNTHAYITESPGNEIVCVNRGIPGECEICALTIGAMSRPIPMTARLACVGDSCGGGDTGIGGVGTGGAADGSILLPDLGTPGSLGVRTSRGYRVGGACRACRGGDCTYHAPEADVAVTLANQSACRVGTVRDRLSCATTCSLAGCGSCLTAPTAENAVTIQGDVYDAFAQLPISGARIILTYRGNRIADTVTDVEGRFRIPNLHGRSECGQYRLAVTAERDNPRTPAVETFGYRAFESAAFSPVDFVTRVTVGGRIELTPRTDDRDAGTSAAGMLPNETRVIVTWTGRLPTFSIASGAGAGRYVRSILPHVILPESRKFVKRPPSTVGGTLSCPTTDAMQLACSLYQPGGSLYGNPGTIRDPMICSRVTVVSRVRSGETTQFACGYMFSTVSGLSATIDPLGSLGRTQGQTGQNAAVCCPRNLVGPGRYFEPPTATSEGTRAISEYLNRNGIEVTPANVARYLTQACCADPPVLLNPTIVGYTTSTSCSVTDAACSANASPSNACCRRDIGSGATWQGASNVLVAPGAVASCKPHLITTEAVCTAKRTGTADGQGTGGALTRLACDLNSSCDEFVRDAPATDPMRVRYIRSLREGEIYRFYLEQAHYGEAEMNDLSRTVATGVSYRCYASRNRAPGTPDYTEGTCSGVYLEVLCDETGPCREVTSVRPPTEPLIECTGGVDTCTNLNGTSYSVLVTIRTGPEGTREIITPGARSRLSTPSDLFTSIGLQVEVLSGTTRTIIRPGSGAGVSCTSGVAPYLWHAFDQNAVTGEITIPNGGVGAWVCDPPTGMTGLNRPLNNNAYRFPGSPTWDPPELGLPADL